ncbi:putative zinc-binding metallopeptidase [uncultured Bacteroides sp.]|uniref:zinc-binding metallopeptidase n=1 Tax=uncultured Bacteroides sp. TaxID=162156 RepID=UPI002AAABCE7|nr:putative zinc-binding metallopeptidase [uncultured Bacteroides sp.]
MNILIKKISFWTALMFAVVFAMSCNDDDKLSSESIFKNTETVENDFDKWLLTNYTYPYNIQFNYRYDDKEVDQDYNVIPAEYDKAIVLAKLIKYLWIDSYNELMGRDFLRRYTPRMIQLIGSPEYNDDGSVVLGTAEGGMKIFLTNVNTINPQNLNLDFVKYNYIKTMFHEFAHILHQTKNYTTDFNLISNNYQGPSWVNVGDYMNTGDTEALEMGFVSAYASSEPQEDFVETLSIYVVYGADYWDELLQKASDGAEKIEAKFDIVKEYLRGKWDIDIVELQKIVQRRLNEAKELDLETLN